MRHVAGLLVTAVAAVTAACVPAAASAAAPGPASGLTDLSAEDAAVLREVRDLLEPIAADPAEAEETRHLALAALDRLHEALGDWGRPGLLDWYFGLLTTTRPGRLTEALLRSGQMASRGGQYHLGGVREFWARIDALAEEQGVELTRRGESQRKTFFAKCQQFEKPRRLAASFKPLVLAVRRVNLSSQLKPYVEPKPPRPAR